MRKAFLKHINRWFFNIKQVLKCMYIYLAALLSV